MTYTALYRRFRPQLFADLVGQEHISRTLAAAIRQGSFVHAYLFCGPRGTGKTSTARIMARAVNCLSPTKAGEPCGECPACQRSMAGEALDILEIDAASNRGIDEIRDLRERVKYAPALEKYKVYIIDEVHMLTSPAFNALLKTLEEPPPQVLFILATTEPHKMPLTVLSRCQRFDFRRIADSELATHLAHVARAEGYTAEPQALALIARKVEGGMRDALGMLDQCAGFAAGHITVEALNKLTGSADAAFIAQMTQLMLAGQAADLISMVEQLHAEGRDLRQFLYDLLEYQRELLLKKLSPGRETLPAWAEAASANQLLKLMQALSDGDGRLRASLQPRLTLELSLLAACGITESEEQRVESKKTMAMAAKKTPATDAPAHKPFSQTPPATVDSPAPESAPATLPLVKADSPASPVAEAGGGETAQVEEGELERLKVLWPQIVQTVGRDNASTGAFLAKARPFSLRQERLTLIFGAEYALFMEKLCKPGPARELLEQKIAALFGRRLSVEGLMAQAEEDAPPPPEEAPPPGEQGSLF